MEYSKLFDCNKSDLMPHLEADELFIWRRFRFKDASKKQAAIALIQQKDLSREDVILLLDTLQITE